jgi:hypothetical protein
MSFRNLKFCYNYSKFLLRIFKCKGSSRGCYWTDIFSKQLRIYRRFGFLDLKSPRYFQELFEIFQSLRNKIIEFSNTLGIFKNFQEFSGILKTLLEFSEVPR